MIASRVTSCGENPGDGNSERDFRLRWDASFVQRSRFGVRPALEADGEAIGEAHAEAWLAAYGEIFDHAFLIAAAEGRRTGWPRLIGELLVPPNRFLVGALDGRVVAFGHAAPTDQSSVAEIVGFYCHPAAWGSGVATALMTQLCHELEGEFERVVLWTLRDAARARRFYEKSGFARTSRERSESLTAWSSATSVSRPAVEYGRKVRLDQG
jgi:ribosomal protein S18 acetylase RimI-like enzyme